MKTTVEFLDEIRRRYQCTDYRVGKMLGLSSSGIGNYRAGRSHLDDRRARKVAELLELDVGFVLACCHAERARDDESRAVWRQIAQRFAAGLVAVALAPLMIGAPEAAGAALRNGNYTPSPAPDRSGIYIMRRHRRPRTTGAAIGAALRAFLHGTAPA